MTDHTDLIRRLRETPFGHVTSALLYEAADALEAFNSDEAVERGARAVARAVLNAAMSDPHSSSVTFSESE